MLKLGSVVLFVGCGANTLSLPEEAEAISLLQTRAQINRHDVSAFDEEFAEDFEGDDGQEEEGDDLDMDDSDQGDILLESNTTWAGYKRCREAPKGSHSACKVIGGGKNFAASARLCALEAKKINADTFQFLANGAKCWLKSCKSINMKYSTEGRKRPWQIFSTYCGLTRVHEARNGDCGNEFTNYLQYPMPPKAACDKALKFQGMKNNNLNGWGPGGGAESFRYSEVLPGVDLIVKADGAYRPNKAELNGVWRRRYGRLNLASGISTDLLFRFVEAEGQAPVKVDNFMFTVFDMDQGTRCQTRLTMNASSYNSYHVSDNTEMIVKTDTGGVGWQASTSFSSSVAGSRKDNPLWPDRLTDLQKGRAVTLYYESVKFFSLKFSITPGKGGRNLLFSGGSSLMDPLCGMHVKKENAK